MDAPKLTTLCSAVIGCKRNQFKKELSQLPKECQRSIDEYTTKQIIPFLAAPVAISDNGLVTPHAVDRSIKRLSLSAQAGKLLGASQDGVRLWDLNQLSKPLLTCTQDDFYGCNMAIDTNGTILASVDYRIKLIDPKTGEYVGVLLHHGGINEIAFVNEHTVASCSNDTTIRFWDLRKQRPFYILTDHTHHVMTIDVSNEAIISFSQDKTIRTWPLPTEEGFRTALQKPDKEYGPETISREPNNDYIKKIFFLRDSNFAVSGGLPTKVWDVKKKECIKIDSTTVTQDGCPVTDKLYATTSMGSGVYLWDPAIKPPLAYAHMLGNSQPGNGICFVSETKKIISSSRQSMLCEWDIGSILQAYDSLSCEERQKLIAQLNDQDFTRRNDFDPMRKNQELKWLLLQQDG